MNKFFEQLPAIIEQSAKTPLGIVALLIITLSIVAYLFFHKASVRVRLVVFLSIGLGFALLLAQILKISNNGAHSLTSITGHVVSLDHLPKLSLEGDEKQMVAALLGYYGTWLTDVKIVVNMGLTQGVAVDDYFAVRDAGKVVTNEKGESLGKINDFDVVLLRVVEVQSRLSICVAEKWAYDKFLKQAVSKIESLPNKDGMVDSDQIAPFFSLVRTGQEAVFIARDEKEMWFSIDKEYLRSEDPQVSPEEKTRRYQDVIAEIDRFLLKYSKGYFAPDAIFRKGVTKANLGEKQSAVSAFELYLYNYPFGVSAEGARDWIKIIQSDHVKGRTPYQQPK